MPELYSYQNSDEDSDEELECKLTLLGLAIWDRNEYYNSKGEKFRIATNKFGIIVAGSEPHGDFAFKNHNNFYNTKREAMLVALKLATNNAERTT